MRANQPDPSLSQFFVFLRILVLPTSINSDDGIPETVLSCFIDILFKSISQNHLFP